jgi:sulfate adenylyltransferase large subunit
VASTTVDIEAFLALEQEKELLRFTTAGSVDDGKSTLIGRLLYDSKGVYEDQLASVQKASANRNAGPIDFSLLTDGLKAEREQGITIDVAYRYFSTPKRKFIIADTPGHEQYTRNMATGASTAELAIVLVDARKGVLPQSRRHAYIAGLLGIPTVVVAVNKMDLMEFSQQVFDDICAEFLEFVRDLGIGRLHFIPISALDGDNVVTDSPRTPWYRGGSLLKYLETVPIKTESDDSRLRFPVQYVVRPTLDFRGYAGQVSGGEVQVGQPVMALPSGHTSRVKSIVTFDGNLETARPPMSVTVTLEDEIDISRGDMLVPPRRLPHVSRRFEARLVWMYADALEAHRPYLLKHTTQQVSCTVTEILHKTDVNSLQEQQTERLALNEIGTVRVETRNPLFFDSYRENRATGSFILIEPLSNLTVAAGMITAPYSVERVTERVSDEERRRRYGHSGFSVWIGDRAELAYRVERELFDRGCSVHVVDVEHPDVLRVSNEAGLVTICTSAMRPEVDIDVADLPENDGEALGQVLSVLESRGYVRRVGSGVDGEGI